MVTRLPAESRTSSIGTVSSKIAPEAVVVGAATTATDKATPCPATVNWLDETLSDGEATVKVSVYGVPMTPANCRPENVATPPDAVTVKQPIPPPEHVSVPAGADTVTVDVAPLPLASTSPVPLSSWTTGCVASGWPDRAAKGCVDTRIPTGGPPLTVKGPDASAVRTPPPVATRR